MKIAATVLILIALIIPQGALAKDQSLALKIELDKKIFYTGKSEKAVMKVGIRSNGQKRERVPVNLVILIDKSASMKGAKIQMACRAAVNAAKRMNKKDIISVVTYGNNVEAVIPAGHILKEDKIKRINRIQSSGNTALFSGLSRAIYELRKNLKRKYINRIVVISDGFANIGIKGIEDYERLGASLKKEMISVSTIGIGTEYNEDLMVALSRSSSGNSYFVEKPARLLKAFTWEMNKLLSIVARDISVTIKCGKNITPLRIVGREGRIKKGVITLSMNQLSSYQRKFALIEIMIPKSKEHKNIVVAKAYINFEDPFVLKKRSIEGFVSASYSNRKNIVKESMNYDVKKSYIKNLNAISTEKALNLFDQGKKQEAVKVMEQASEKLKEAAEITQDEEVQEEASELKKDILEVKKRGILSNKKRKVIKMKSYKTMTQQAN